jgi:hypothetical protein
VVGTLRDLVAQHCREQVLAWAGAGGAALGVLLPNLTGGVPDADSIRLQLFEALVAWVHIALRRKINICPDVSPGDFPRKSKMQARGTVLSKPNSSYNICRVDYLLSILLSPA